MPLRKNVLKPIAKSILMPLELTASASAIHAAIQKNIFGSDMIRLYNHKQSRWYHENC